MTKKDLYRLSVRLSSGVLVQFFNAPASNFDDMEATRERKAARKLVYETLVPLLLDPDPVPGEQS